MKTIDVKAKGRKPKNTEIFKIISEIKVGEFRIIKNEEWLLKTPAGKHIIRQHTDFEFRVQTLSDDSGWKVTRL